MRLPWIARLTQRVWLPVRAYAGAHHSGHVALGLSVLDEDARATMSRFGATSNRSTAGHAALSTKRIDRVNFSATRV
jgi:hypothetical protein